MPKLFDRMIHDLEFDISEMAIVTFLQLKQMGAAFTGLPLFPMRAFPQSTITYNVNSGITSPKDLEGRKVGVRAYAGTAGVWARGLLASEYGVDLSKVTWVLTDIEHLGDMPNPSNTVSMEGASLPDMLTSGEIDAGIGVMGVDSPDVKPLISNAREAQADWFNKTGVFPINNTMVVRDEVLAANPDIAPAFFAAYKEAKALYLQRLKADGAQARDEEADQRYADIVGGDPLPIGIGRQPHGPRGDHALHVRAADHRRPSGGGRHVRGKHAGTQLAGVQPEERYRVAAGHPVAHVLRRAYE